MDATLVNVASTGSLISTLPGGSIVVYSDLQFTITTTTPMTIDGIVLSTGNFLMVKNEIPNTQNGIYTLVSITNLGDGSSRYIFRINQESAAIVAGKLFYILSGSVNANTFWIANVSSNFTQGISPCIFVSPSENPITPGNLKIGGYLRVGSTSDPLNTTPGDITGVRLNLGNNSAFSAANGKFIIANGTTTETTGTIYGVVSNISAQPTGTMSGTQSGNIMSLTTSNNNAFTGKTSGLISNINIGGSGDFTSAVATISAPKITSSLANKQKIGNNAINNPGTGYVIGNVLNVQGDGVPVSPGFFGGQITITSVDGSGSILTYSVTNAGGNYVISTGNTLTGGSGSGATFNIISISSTGITNTVGLQVQGIDADNFISNGTITNCIGMQVIDSNPGLGPMTLSNQIGVDIPTMNKGTSNTIGLRIAAPTSGVGNNFALQFVAGTTFSSGITWGTDTNLYRSAANVLRTDDSFTASLDITGRHFLCSNLVTGSNVVAGTGAGTGPTITVTAGSTDAGQRITVLTGAAPASNVIFVLTYATAYPNTVSAVVFSPANAAAAALSGSSNPYISAQSTTTFTFRSGTTPLAAATSYIWNFSVRA